MTIDLLHGDITLLEVDAIVNAANSSLMGGGGVDGAIHRAGGGRILEECLEIKNTKGGCRTGEAVITTAGILPAQKVIHTVGPIWNSGKQREDELLRSCYTNSLKLAEKYSFESIAFPNISTGVYGYPKKEAAQIAIDTVKNFNYSSLKRVVFVCFDSENFEIYSKLL